MPHSPQIKMFATGSRRGDLLVFMLLASLVLASSYRLRVYFQITVIEVSVLRVTPEGARQPLSTPEQFRGLRSTTQTSQVFLDRLERRIRKYMRQSTLLSQADPGSRLEWIIRYAPNPMSLDNKQVIVFEADDFANP